MNFMSCPSPGTTSWKKHFICAPPGCASLSLFTPHVPSRPVWRLWILWGYLIKPFLFKETRQMGMFCHSRCRSFGTVGPLCRECQLDAISNGRTIFVDLLRRDAGIILNNMQKKHLSHTFCYLFSMKPFPRSPVDVPLHGVFLHDVRFWRLARRLGSR